MERLVSGLGLDLGLVVYRISLHTTKALRAAAAYLST